MVGLSRKPFEVPITKGLRIFTPTKRTPTFAFSVYQFRHLTILVARVGIEPTHSFKLVAYETTEASPPAFILAM